MYTRQEASLIRKKFWTLFGQYMRPIKNTEGETINWINYTTGIRHIFFRMDSDQDAASISIEIRHPDTAMQKQYLDRLEQFKQLLYTETNEEWSWELFKIDENGQTICQVTNSMPDVNIFHEPDWPVIISFLKTRIIALDRFWTQVKQHIE